MLYHCQREMKKLSLSLSLSSFCNSKWGKDMCPLASCHAPSRDWTDVPKTLLNTSWIILSFLPDFCHLSLQAAVLSEVVCSSQHHIPVGWSTWSTLSLAFESCLVFLLFGDLWSTMRLSSPHPAGPRMHTESYWVNQNEKATFLQLALQVKTSFFCTARPLAQDCGWLDRSNEVNCSLSSSQILLLLWPMRHSSSSVLNWNTWEMWGTASQSQDNSQQVENSEKQDQLQDAALSA